MDLEETATLQFAMEVWSSQTHLLTDHPKWEYRSQRLSLEAFSMDLQKVTEDHSKKLQSGGTTVMAKEETHTCVEIVAA